jgi:hypothetical protein
MFGLGEESVLFITGLGNNSINISISGKYTNITVTLHHLYCTLMYFRRFIGFEQKSSII